MGIPSLGRYQNLQVANLTNLDSTKTEYDWCSVSNNFFWGLKLVGFSCIYSNMYILYATHIRIWFVIWCVAFYWVILYIMNLLRLAAIHSYASNASKQHLHAIIIPISTSFCLARLYYWVVCSNLSYAITISCFRSTFWQ